MGTEKISSLNYLVTFIFIVCIILLFVYVLLLDLYFGPPGYKMAYCTPVSVTSYGREPCDCSGLYFDYCHSAFPCVEVRISVQPFNTVEAYPYLSRIVQKYTSDFNTKCSVVNCNVDEDENEKEVLEFVMKYGSLISPSIYPCWYNPSMTSEVVVEGPPQQETKSPLRPLLVFLFSLVVLVLFKLYLNCNNNHMLKRLSVFLSWRISKACLTRSNLRRV